eukprot:762521-Hanusia_phi.AAC.6
MHVSATIPLREDCTDSCALSSLLRKTTATRTTENPDNRVKATAQFLIVIGCELQSEGGKDSQRVQDERGIESGWYRMREQGSKEDGARI